MLYKRERERERVLQAETIKPVERDDHNYTVQYPPLEGAGIAQWLERRTRD